MSVFIPVQRPGFPIKLLVQCRKLLRLSAAVPEAVEAVLAPPAVRLADETGFCACGWFDSSHELNQGLQVQELDTPESLAAALPLALWLERELVC